MNACTARPFRRSFGSNKKIAEEKKTSVYRNRVAIKFGAVFHGSSGIMKSDRRMKSIFGWSLQTARHLYTHRHTYTKVFNACSDDEQRSHQHTHTHTQKLTPKKSRMNIFWQIYYVRAVLSLNYISRAERDKTIFYFIIIITFLFMQRHTHSRQHHFSRTATTK